MICSPPWCYVPDPTNIILVVSPKNVLQAESYFPGIELLMVTGSCYLGGIISDKVVETLCIEKKFQGLTSFMELMFGMARQHPQTAYAGMQKSLQQKWAFVKIQSVNPGVGESFQPVKEALQNSFLPTLFRGATTNIPVKSVIRLPTKQAGIAQPNKNLSTSENWTASCIFMGHLVTDI